MKSSHGIGLVIAWLLMMTSLAAGQTDDFYQTRLALGREAYRQSRFAEAVDQLRIAAFGFLERPAELSEALARLALAEEAAGRGPESDATLGRFLEVERRFGSYANLRLEPEIRADFQTLLRQRVAQATLLSLPSLAALVETEEQKLSKLPPKERRKALEAGQRGEPDNVAWPLGLAREAAGRGDHAAVVKWATKALEIDGRSAEALALRAHARFARREFGPALSDLAVLRPEQVAARPDLAADRFVSLVETGDWAAAEAALPGVPPPAASRRDVARSQQRLAVERRPRAGGQSAGATSGPSADRAPAAGNPAARSSSAEPPPAASAATPALSGRAREALAESTRLVKAGRAGEAEKILVQTLDSEPRNRDLRLALLEASCLSRSWQRAAAQIPLVSPFSDQEVAPLFYAAVVLYETGRTEEARGYLQRALPRVSGSLVDEYSRKILGRL